MKSIFKNKKVGVLVLCLWMPFASFAQDDSKKLAQDLTFYCANSDVEYQESVRIDAGTRVSLLQNLSVLAAQTQAEIEPSKSLIRSQLLKIGVKDDCAELLLTHGKVSDNVNARVYFSFDRAHLTPESIYVLDSLLKQIEEKSPNLLINGYTDSTGSKDYNFSLGMRRAESVKEYLVSKQLDDENITTNSYGETQPIASNETAEGRQLNRRVEITQE